jgi:RNA polymerase sigma factor (sigma-70 family)
VQVTSLLHRLEKTLTAESDIELLERFLADRDPSAFRIIVSRHGPMVYRVCRRLLRSDADAEDAFQATFLVLLRKASGIRKRTSLASWLHGVARQASLRMRTSTQRRHEREILACRAEAVHAVEVGSEEIREIFDEELTRLPERLRSPLVLCYLEGLTQDEAAAHLGLARRTFQRYLESGRTLLGTRLRRRGVTLSTMLLTTLASECIAAMPAPLADGTTALVAVVLGGKDLATHSPSLNILTQEVIRHMFTTRRNWKWLAIALVGIGLGTAVLGSHLAGGQSPAVVDEIKALTAAVGAPDKPAELPRPGDEIAWGKAVDGLKAGIGFRRGEEHSCRVGGSATLVVYLHNENQAPITVTYAESIFDERVPHVRDARGQAVSVYRGTIVLGELHLVPRTLEPGQTIRLDYAWFLVRSTDWKGKVESPTLLAKPGVYTVACMNIPLRLKGRDRDETSWSTGWAELKVEVESAAREISGTIPKVLVDGGSELKFEKLIRSKLGLGLTAADPTKVKATSQDLRGGMEVTAVDSGSVAAKAGIHKGDILVGLQMWEMLSLDNVGFVLEHPEKWPSSQLEFHLVRDGKVFKATVEGGSLAAKSVAGSNEDPAVHEAQASLLMAELKVKKWQAEMDRMRKLVDQRALDKQTLMECENKLAEAKAEWEVAKAKLEALLNPQAQAGVEKAVVWLAEVKVSRWLDEASRLRKLYDQGAIDKHVLDESESQLKAAKAELEVAKAKVNALQNSPPKSLQLAPAQAGSPDSAAKLQGEIDVAKASVQLAEAEFVHRKHIVERNQDLMKKGVLDKGSLEEAEDQLRIAAAALDLAKAKLKALLGK